MMEVVLKGGMLVFVVSGMTPPRMAMVEGGRKRVVCSWRGNRGMGARVCHVGFWFLRGGEGWARVRVRQRRMEARYMVGGVES
jgi:hypothetical protein